MSTEIAALQAQVKQLQDDLQHLKWYLGLPHEGPLKNNMRPSLRCRCVTLENEAGEAIAMWDARTAAQGPCLWMAAAEPGETFVELGVDPAIGGYVTVNAPDGTARAQLYVQDGRGEMTVSTAAGAPRAIL